MYSRQSVFDGFLYLIKNGYSMKNIKKPYLFINFTIFVSMDKPHIKFPYGISNFSTILIWFYIF